jgi:RNA polymerase sigma-70 factor (ECF subfamily)
MSDLGDRLQRGDASVCLDIEDRFGRAVIGWLRSKYSSLTAAQAREALQLGLANLWSCREKFDPAKTSVSKRLNHFAEIAALGLLLKSDFATVVESLGKAVQGYITWLLRRCGYNGDVQETAEDVRQQTFLAAWRSLDRFDPSRSVKAWLWKIARNCLLSELRRRHRKPAALTPDYLEAHSQAHDDDELPGVLRDFCEVLAGIPGHHQDLLYMSVENNRRYGPEAVKHLDFSSPTSVRVTRSRLFKRIRGEMQRRGHFPQPVAPPPGDAIGADRGRVNP